jgi:hypothetical protein
MAQSAMQLWSKFVEQPKSAPPQSLKKVFQYLRFEPKVRVRLQDLRQLPSLRLDFRLEG